MMRPCGAVPFCKPARAGRTARVQNFGLRDMRLVRPAGGEWPNERARAVSARAIDVLDGAKVGKDNRVVVSSGMRCRIEP